MEIEPEIVEKNPDREPYKFNQTTARTGGDRTIIRNLPTSSNKINKNKNTNKLPNNRNKNEYSNKNNNVNTNNNMNGSKNESETIG